MTQTEAVQHLSKGGTKKVTGKKKTATRKVAGKKAVGRKATTRNELIIINPKKAAHKSAATGTPTQKAIKIQNRIDTLERQRSQQKSKQVKDVFALAINKEHAKLRTLQQQLRK